jgi:hypothetical protein
LDNKTVAPPQIACGIAPESNCLLLDRTGDRGEYIIGIGPDEPHSSDDNDQDHCQHNRVFRDILSFLFAPKSAYQRHKKAPFLFVNRVARTRSFCAESLEIGLPD